MQIYHLPTFPALYTYSTEWNLKLHTYIQQHEWWVCEEFACNVCPLLFTTRKTTFNVVTNNCKHIPVNLQWFKAPVVQIIMQCKPMKCTFSKLILKFLIFMSSTCFEPEGSSPGRWLYMQLWYGMFTCIDISSLVSRKVPTRLLIPMNFVGLHCIIILQWTVQKT